MKKFMKAMMAGALAVSVLSMAACTTTTTTSGGNDETTKATDDTTAAAEPDAPYPVSHARSQAVDPRGRRSDGVCRRVRRTDHRRARVRLRPVGGEAALLPSAAWRIRY